jgi:uncharacterized protein
MSFIPDPFQRFRDHTGFNGGAKDKSRAVTPLFSWKAPTYGKTISERPPDMTALPVPVLTIGLLVLSNIFMTFAWYGHLTYKSAPLITVILVSWGIAFFEYCLMVPANRIGHGTFSAAQLKTIQEVITLTVFMGFSALYLGEPIRWNHLVGFAFIVLGAWFVFAEFGRSA